MPEKRKITSKELNRLILSGVPEIKSVEVTENINTHINREDSLTFLNCSFKSLNLGGEIKNIGFRDCSIENIELTNLQTDHLNFYSCGSIKTVELWLACRIKRFSFQRTESDLIIIDGGARVRDIDLYSSKNDIKTVGNLTLYLNSDVNINMVHYKIDIFKLSGNFTDKSNILSRNVDVNTLSFENFNNYSSITVDFLSDKFSFLEFKNSDMGNILLKNIRLKGKNQLIIQDSIFEKLRYLNVEWGDKSTILYERSKDPKDIFRQLKVAAQNQQDKIQSLIFESYEMDEWKPDNLWDKIIKYSSKWTNYYGLKWHYALIWLICLGFVSMLLIFLLNPCLSKYTWYHFGTFTFYPIHRTTDIFGKNPSNSIVLIDSMWRFVSGFLLFQLISAFRKYFKK